jgi:Ca-activated chloride channel family protein
LSRWGVATATTLPGAASAKTRREAAAFLDGVKARGGTEMSAPLELGLDLVAGGYADREHIVVLVTDGQITNEADVLQALEGRLKNARVLAVGIDVAVNSAFLTRLATTSGGLCELVESEERLDDVMERIHLRLRAPLLTELALTLADVDEDRDAVPRLPFRQVGENVAPDHELEPGARVPWQQPLQ